MKVLKKVYTNKNQWERSRNEETKELSTPQLQWIVLLQQIQVNEIKMKDRENGIREN